MLETCSKIISDSVSQRNYNQFTCLNYNKTIVAIYSLSQTSGHYCRHFLIFEATKSSKSANLGNFLLILNTLTEKL